MKKAFVFSFITVTILIFSASQVHAIYFQPKKADSAAVTNNKTAVKSALNEYKSLSHQEKRSRINEAKKALKGFKGSDADTNTILLCVLAILLPPLAVYIKEKDTNTKFWISVLLTLLFWIPGVIYALLVVLDVI